MMLIAASSFSFAETALTTSHNTPISMFITVRAVSKTKTKNMATDIIVWNSLLCTRNPKTTWVSRRNVPSMSSVHMHRGKVRK